MIGPISIEGEKMISVAEDVEDHIDSLDPRWKDMVIRIREVLLKNLPEGFEETMQYEMIGYVVPHSIYPDGYHVNPDEPLPFIHLAASKNHVSLYHMGIYGNEELEKWFLEGYREEVGKKPNMGKSCIRFRKEEDIPMKLLEELSRKITVDDYVGTYRENMKKIKKE